MFETLAVLFTLIGGGFVAATVSGKSIHPGANHDSTLTFAQRIQKRIYLLMANESFMNWLARIKYGGSQGLPGNAYTNKVVILHKALEALGEAPKRQAHEGMFNLWLQDIIDTRLSLDDYQYPGLADISNNQTTNGFDRDRPGIWEQVFNAVLNHIPYVSNEAKQILKQLGWYESPD